MGTVSTLSPEARNILKTESSDLARSYKYPLPYFKSAIEKKKRAKYLWSLQSQLANSYLKDAFQWDVGLFSSLGWSFFAYVWFPWPAHHHIQQVYFQNMSCVTLSLLDKSMLTPTHHRYKKKKTPQHHKESKSLSFEKYWQQKYSKVHREQEWFLRNFWTRWMGKDTYQTLMTRVWLLQPSWCWKARINSCKLPSDLHTHICSEGMHRHAEAN